ncbi:hypothetical protein XA68_12752 [Ophiocordyceps unilateralis]|uniref:Nephrocystin 3-like N-terminal domain-containing protein n=1 Tax=Ophiocordyceps unilateralis TaxID=268505 RepID=A0A2A9PCL1_OPHUN|nr:hypothetical protein XA68_12752 [Ophiocordyceps unilateralis]
MESSHDASPYEDMQQGVKLLHPSDEQQCLKTKIDVVLVPGLGANPEKSWMSAKGDFNWPTDPKGLVGDNADARILLHMYESAWQGQRKVNQSISNAAGSLLQGLAALSPPNGKSRKPIVFVGHSMGGLVIAKAVTLMKREAQRWPNMLEHVAGAIFFGTPFRGADSAVWAGIWAKLNNSVFAKDLKSQLLDLMDPRASGIHELRNEFNQLATTLQPPIKLCCFWEQEETDPSDFVGQAHPFSLIKGFLPRSVRIEMVSQYSATLDGARSIGLACDHRGLVKFKGPKDMNWAHGVRTPLRDIISEGPSTVRKRLMAIRDVDHELISRITKALETGPVNQKRNALSKTFKPSSWIPVEQEFVEWLDLAWIRQPSARDETEDQVKTYPSRSYIWIRGPQGRGKTSATLAAIAEVEDMRLNRQMNNPDDQVLKAYFFCNEKDEYSTAEDLLKSIIVQLIEQDRSLAVYAKQFIKEDREKEMENDKDHHPKPPAQATVENLWRALHDMLWGELAEPRTRVYLLLNNLHALPRPSESTDKLLSYVNKALDPDVMGDNLWPRSARWFITSRDDVGCIENTLDVKGKRLINLLDPKYESKVQKELRNYAKMRLDALAKKKNYNKVLRLVIEGLVGWRASSTQWIDVMYMLLEELNGEDDAHVRSELETMPQELHSLLKHSWQGFFKSNTGAMHNMKEMLRTLVLTYDDPSESELAVLAGFESPPARRRELHALIDKCKPLLRTRFVRVGQSSYTVVGFASAYVKEHLLENSDELLGLSDEKKKFQHGIITHRCFEDLEYRFVVDPEETARLDDSPEADVPGESEEDTDDTETDDSWIHDVKTSYSVKYWLKHASEATLEVAQQLSQEKCFWKHDSPIRRGWLDEYSQSEGTFEGMDLTAMTSLHIACSIGYQELVEALIQEGYGDQINVHDKWENTPLHLAAFFDQGRIIDTLLRCGAQVDDQGSTGFEETPLHMAAHKGRLDVISKLVREKANPNAVASEIGPVINAAICSGVEEAVYRLVECGARLDMFPKPGEQWCSPVELAALHWNLPMFESFMKKSEGKIPPSQYSMALVQAAYGGRNDVFEKLLEFPHGRDVYHNALRTAAEEENWEICKMILEKCRGLDCRELFYQAARCTDSQVPVLEAAWNYSDRSISRQTLADSLYEAIDMEKEDTVEFLLNTCQADPDATGEDFGNALTAAAFHGAEKIVQMLLKAGANVNSPNGWALQEAAAEGNLNVVRILLDRGADVNAVIENEDFEDGTALQGACEAAEPGIVDLLLDRHADPNLGCGPNSPPIVAAAVRGAEDILEKLIEAKAKVNVFDGDNETTLLNKATTILSVDSLRRLLDAGANVNLADNEGDTPLLVAAAMDEDEAVDLFLEYGADILHVNDEGKNAMQVALQNGSQSSLKTLIDRVSGVLASLRTRRDMGSTEVAQVVSKAFGPSGDGSTKMKDEEQDDKVKENRLEDVQNRCVNCPKLEERTRPMVTPNFYQTCVDQPPSLMVHEPQPPPRPSDGASTSERISRKPLMDPEPALFHGQARPISHLTPDPSQQGPAAPQGQSPNNADGRPAQGQYGHSPGQSMDGGAGVGSSWQHQGPDSKQKRRPLISVNREALNDMREKTEATVGKAMEKGKALWSRR